VQSTDVHRQHAQAWIEQGDREVDRSRELALKLSGSGPGWPSGRSAWEQCSWFLHRSTDRSIDRSKPGCDQPSDWLATSMVIYMTTGRSISRSICLARKLSPTA